MFDFGYAAFARDLAAFVSMALFLASFGVLILAL